MTIRRSWPRLLRGALAACLLATSAVTVALSAPGHAAGARCVAPPVAHRGDSERAPENTLPAYRAASRAGVTRWELDVRFTADGVPVLMHDPWVGRTTDGTGRVGALTLAQVRTLDAGSWFADRFTGVPVPTLGQLLVLGHRRGALLLVELKTRPTQAQLSVLLERVTAHRMTDRVRIASFDEETLLAVRAAAPGMRTALIDNPRFRPPESILRYGTTYLAHRHSVTEERMRLWQQAGIDVRPWPVDSVKEWRRMARGRSGPVVTNRPASYLRWARTYCAAP